jgi:hypothetical protein
MKIVNNKISLTELKSMSQKMDRKLVKAVVDTEKEIMAVDVDMHVDAEAELLEHDSEQENLWGINIHPEEPKEKRIEFDSMINIRPSQGNRSRSVENPVLQQKIIAIVNRLVSE